MGIDDWMNDDAALDAALAGLGSPNGAEPVVGSGEILAHATSLLEAASVGGLTAAQQATSVAVSQSVGIAATETAGVAASLTGWKLVAAAVGLVSSGFLGGVVVHDRLEWATEDAVPRDQSVVSRLDSDDELLSRPDPIDDERVMVPRTRERDVAIVAPPPRSDDHRVSSQVDEPSNLPHMPMPAPDVQPLQTNADVASAGSPEPTLRAVPILIPTNSEVETLEPRGVEENPSDPHRPGEPSTGGSASTDVLPEAKIEDSTPSAVPRESAVGDGGEQDAIEPRLRTKQGANQNKQSSKADTDATVKRDRGAAVKKGRLNGALFTGAMSHFRQRQPQALRLGAGAFWESSRPTFIRAGLDVSMDIYPLSNAWVTNVGAELGLGTTALPGRLSFNWLVTVQDEKQDPACHRGVGPNIEMCSAWLMGPRIRGEITERVWVATDVKIPVGAFAPTSFTSVGLIVGVNGWKRRN